MRLWYPSSMLVAAWVSAAGLAPAAAQVSVDLHALDKLPQGQPARLPDAGGPAPTRHPPRQTGTAHAEQHRPPTHEHGQHAPSHAAGHAPTEAAGSGKTGAPPQAAVGAVASKPTAAAAGPAHPVAAHPPAATLPTATPPPVVLAPVPTTPLANATAATKPQVAPDAGGEMSWLVDGMRVTFLPGRSDLSPETSDAVKRLAAMVPPSENFSLDVRAYAAAVPDDPSAARRLSLSRSLAIRAVLMAQGIPSTRIFLRALGADAGTGTADRCDIMVARLGHEAPVPGLPPPAAAPLAAATPAASTTGTSTTGTSTTGTSTTGTSTTAAAAHPPAGATPPTARP